MSFNLFSNTSNTTPSTGRERKSRRDTPGFGFGKDNRKALNPEKILGIDDKGHFRKEDSSWDDILSN